MASTLTIQNLQAPTSGPNANTVLIPEGHAMSGTLHNTILTGNTTVTGTITGAAGVVQVVQGELGTTTSGTPVSGTNNFYDSGLQAFITPTSASSKILVTYTIHMGSDVYQIKSRILRDSTPVGLGTSEGGRGVASSASINYDDNATTNDYLHSPLGITYLDTPSTTNQITYKIQVGSYSNVDWYVNRGKTFQNGTTLGYDAIPLSTITLMEIAV